MIYTERKISIKNDKTTIDSPIILFRGDREVEIMFTIVDSKFKFESNKGNVIDKTQAAFGQLAVALPDGTDLFTEIVETQNGVVVFSITGEMIDEIQEVGFYSFHIRLYNDDKTSRITLPPVMEGIEIREPLIIEGDVENTDLVGDATVGYSMVQTAGVDEEVFDEDGNYIPTVWGIGDKITANKLNKLETGLSNMTPDISINEVMIDSNDTVIETDLFVNNGYLEVDDTAATQPYAQQDFINKQCTADTVNIGVKYIDVGVGQIHLCIIDNNMNKLIDKLVNIEVTQNDVTKGKGIVEINIGECNLEPGYQLVIHTLQNTNLAILYNSQVSGIIGIYDNDISSILTTVGGQFVMSLTLHKSISVMEHMDRLYAKKDDVDANNVKIDITNKYVASGNNPMIVMNQVYSNNTLFSNDINVTKFTGLFTIEQTGTYPINLYVVDYEGGVIDSLTYNIECTEVGTMHISINNMSMIIPTGCYLAMETPNANMLLNYYRDSTDTDIYGWSKQGESLTITQTLTSTSLIYELEYTERKSIGDLLLNGSSRLTYKKVIAIGDSMVQGHSISKDAGWLAMIAKRNQMKYVNYGINGRYMSNKLYGESKGVVDSFQDMDDDADYIIVFAGTNDAGAKVTIGADDSTEPSEFKGALNIICNGLLTKYPTKHIMFITPYLRNNDYPEYIEAIETICAKYSIPVFNNAKNGGICWSNQAQVDALTLGDTLHLNLAGMEYASYKYEAFLKNL
jgi:lysophospholipase L1-like esterase